MSHVDGQPYEVPEREVDHGFSVDDYAIIETEILGVGTLREREWWGSQEELDEFDADIARRDEARRRLGGFGFGARS